MSDRSEDRKWINPILIQRCENTKTLNVKSTNEVVPRIEESKQTTFKIALL